MSRNDRKNNERVLQTNEKTSGNQALQKKFHQWDKNLSRLAHKILGTILKMKKGGTQRNGPKYEK